MYANIRWTLGKSYSCLCRHSLDIALIEPSHNEAIYSEINLPFSGDSEWEIAPSNLKVEKVIGHGAFGVVSRGLAFNLPGRPGWTVVAVKSVQGNKWLNLSTSSFNSFVCSNLDFESRTWHIPWVPEVFLACGGNFRCGPKADTSSAVGRSREKNLWHGAVLFSVPVDLCAFLSDYIYANQIESLQLWSCGPAREEVSKDRHYP